LPVGPKFVVVVVVGVVVEKAKIRKGEIEIYL